MYKLPGPYSISIKYIYGNINSEPSLIRTSMSMVIVASKLPLRPIIICTVVSKAGISKLAPLSCKIDLSMS